MKSNKMNVKSCTAFSQKPEESPRSATKRILRSRPWDSRVETATLHGQCRITFGQVVTSYKWTHEDGWRNCACTYIPLLPIPELLPKFQPAPHPLQTRTIPGRITFLNFSFTALCTSAVGCLRLCWTGADTICPKSHRWRCHIAGGSPCHRECAAIAG
jgi:hypothetical protein